jgi:4-amino-4-deoxy-L-arabinose transferase-like glycosyltransferase
MVNSETLSIPSRRAGWGVLALCAMVALVVFVRLRLLQIPLERDEGEYAYAGQLMLEGVPPYQMAWNMKLPGTYAAYATIMALFGQSIGGIHLGFLFANLGALALLFFIARRLTGFWGAVMACASYALMSLSPGVLGLAGHATHLVTLAALGGLWLLLRARETGSGAGLFWSGLCFGLAFLCKQPGACFGLFGFCLTLRDAARMRPVAWRRLLRNSGLFSAGMILPFALTCLILWRLGTFERFWFWTITYARRSTRASCHGADGVGPIHRSSSGSSGSVKWSLPLGRGRPGLPAAGQGQCGQESLFSRTLLGFSAAGLRRGAFISAGIISS